MAESAKPLVVDGVTVKPKWEWSPEYRAEVRRSLTATTPADRERREAAELEYVRQWAQRRGLPCATSDEIEDARWRLSIEQKRVPA